MPSQASPEKTDRLTERIRALPQRPDHGWSEDELALLGEIFIDAILTSADVDTIGAKNWWDRARTALETGCAVGDGIRAVTARAAKKLQVQTLDGRTSHAVKTLDALLSDRQDFRRWRTLCIKDAVFLVAMVRCHREEHRETTKTKTGKLKAEKPATQPAPESDALPF